MFVLLYFSPETVQICFISKEIFLLITFFLDSASKKREEKWESVQVTALYD